MNADNNGNNPINTKDDAVVSPGSRRRFVRGVGVVVPSVLTVVSRSTLAAVCHSPSATASINLANSRPDRPGDVQCLGRSPGFWVNSAKNQSTGTTKSQTTNPPKNHSTDWQAISAEGVLFGSIYFGGFPGKTLKEVMGMNGHEDSYQLGAHLAAAWCNWKRGWVPDTVLSLADLQTMWAGRFGNYSPVGGVVWGAEEIVAYLKTTMTL